jgi:small subunit ribosomal protein S29
MICRRKTCSSTSSICKFIDRVKIFRQGYHKFCNHLWRPFELRSASNDRFKGNNTGILFWGERGTGKSQILSYVTAWAHEKKWINLTISNHEDLVGGDFDILRHKNGLYLQFDLGKELLLDFKHANEQFLTEFDVDMTYYGKYDISGIRDGEPEPNPKVWDPLRKVWSDSWKENLLENEIIDQNAQNERLNYRLSDKLRDPKKLIDIVDAGINDPEISVSAFGEVLE